MENDEKFENSNPIQDGEEDKSKKITGKQIPLKGEEKGPVPASWRHSFFKGDKDFED